MRFIGVRPMGLSPFSDWTYYLNTATALRSYDPSQLREDLRTSYVSDPSTLDAMAATVDARVQSPLALSAAEVDDILAFLTSLTDPSARNLTGTIPPGVPSGLSVGD